MAALRPRRLVVLAAVMLALPLLSAGPADASVSAGVSSGKLVITGDGFADQVALRLHLGDTTTLDIDFDNNGVIDGSFPRSSFNQIAINMGGGADSVRIDDSAGGFTSTEITEMFGGDGNDTLTGGEGAELLVGGAVRTRSRAARGTTSSTATPGTTRSYGTPWTETTPLPVTTVPIACSSMAAARMSNS
jgi:hypothetical protein